MKVSITIFFLILIWCLNASFIKSGTKNQIIRGNPYELRLKITENSTAGSRWRTYVIAKGKLRIYDKPFFSSKLQEHLFTDHKFPSEEFFQKLSELGLDTLQNQYFAKCPSKELTLHYVINLKQRSRTIKTELHNYYKEEVHNLIKLINNYLPRSLLISYLSTDPKNDCP
jgi:hypothetical protein